jgi:hypothetical protein
MPLLFAATLFLSATLLFLLQPLVGKMLLPYFGGAAAVWNTCMVFFQALLLAGYSYAHAGPALLGTRRHVIFHLLFLAAVVVALPFAVSPEAAPPPGVDPTFRLLLVLFVAVGLPFFVVSTTAPLVQHWFAATGHRSGRDPYFLYAASNAGSMVGLLAYPFVIEPLLPLHRQANIWAGGYIVLLLLLVACGIAVWRARPAAAALGATPPAEDAAPPPSWLRRLRWIALAFVPSSLLLGVTTHLSIDVAPMPLLWVLPLAVYLLSFILVFGPLLARGLHLFGTLLPIIVLAQAFFLVARPDVPLEQMITANLLTLFVAAMVCHGELARTRPAARHLTEFYLWMSLGGVLGGAFNALAAPLLFPGTYEYPLALVLLCLLAPPPARAEDPGTNPEASRPREKGGARTSTAVTSAERRGGVTKRPGGRSMPRRSVAVTPRSASPLLLAPVVSAACELLAAGILIWLFPRSVWLYAGLLVLLSLSAYAKALRLTGDAVRRTRLSLLLDLAIPACLGFVAFAALWREPEGPLQMSVGLLTLLGLSLYGRPLRLGLGIAVLVIVGLWARESREGVVYRHRDFYGTLRVVGRYSLYHGQTIHGAQGHTGTPKDMMTPLIYYYPTGPAGDVFKTFVKGHDGFRIGVIGLGTGSLAAYGEKGQHFTFFEIDPTVIELARDSPYFTYLRDSPATSDVVPGDARLTLRDQPPGAFDVLVIDAFSGDAIPTHLLTREALRIYREHLAPGGLLLFHISSLYFDLEPLLSRLAEAEGLQGLARRDRATKEEQLRGKVDSSWVVLAAPGVDLTRLNQLHRWHKLRTRPGLAAWTDDFSSLLSVLGISKEAGTADP